MLPLYPNKTCLLSAVPAPRNTCQCVCSWAQTHPFCNCLTPRSVPWFITSAHMSCGHEQQSSVSSCSIPEMAGLARASSLPLSGTKTHARHTALLLKVLATKQEVPFPRGVHTQSKSRSTVTASCHSLWKCNVKRDGTTELVLESLDKNN